MLIPGRSAPLHMRLLAGFGLVLALSAGQSLFAHWTGARNVAAVESQQHIEEISSLAADTRTALLQMEGGFGAYLLRGDEASLAAYTDGAQAYAKDLAALEVLSASEQDVEEVARWQDLKRRGLFWQQYSTEPGIALRRLVPPGSPGGQATIAYASSALTEHDIADIKSVLDQAIEQESGLLMQSRTATLDANNLLMAANLVGALLVLGAGVLVALMSAGNLGRAITRQRAADRELTHQALHDPLTSLANRTLLHLQLTRSFEGDVGGGGVGLLVLDLDRFKDINDALGHQVGDVLLRQIGERLQTAVPPTGLVARLGGDEFAVLLPKTGVRDAARMAEELVRVLKAPFLLDGQLIGVEASIGVAVAPDHAQNADTLLRCADSAMYQAKRSGIGPAIYQLDQDHNSADRLGLLAELRHAIDADELLLHYQPKLDLRDGTLVGVEALVRWQHPQRGFLPPSEFIPLAEQTELIHPLSHWVLEAALRQQREWRALGWDISVAVNLSRRMLHDPGLPDTIVELLGRYGLPPSALVLEITESSLMTDLHRAGENLEHLHALGVQIAIDDFGTGYSSLASLKSLSVDELKIDQSFVRGMATDASSRAIVRTIIDLADALELRVVAEGVEDRATWDVLAGLGCDVAQGYFLSRPIAATELEAWLAQRGSSWLEIAAQPRDHDPLQERIRGRGARLTAEEEFIGRKEAESALQASEERNRVALRAAGVGTWDVDVASDVHTWSPEMRALFGLAPDTLAGDTATLLGAIHPDDWAELDVQWRAALSGQGDFSMCYRTVWPDGSTHWLEDSGRALYASDGTAIRISGICKDVTERKLAEEALRANEEHFRNQYKSFPLPTYSWLQVGDDFVLQDFNDAAEAITNGRIADGLGASASEWYGAWPDILADLHTCLREQRSLSRETRYRYRTTGVSRQLLFSFVFVSPQTVMVHTEDVTEAREADQQREVMAQSEKLRALGQMATGIAHDLNQSLMLVASYSDLARQMLAQDGPNLEEVENLLTTATQAAIDGGETVNRLLLFTRAAPANVNERVELAQVVREAVHLTAPRWRDASQAEARHISLHVETAAEPTIQGSPARLRELMTNLIFNAVDALPTGGTISLRVAVEDAQGIIEITDSGVGMSAEVQARLYEPFFTTKGERGSGLGLAMVFGIVEQHAGHIQVRSLPGEGTTFRIAFPLAVTSENPAQSVTPEAPLEPLRQLRVLAVDDEPLMTKAVVRMLRPMGHQISVAASGEEAMQQLNAHTFDVVVSDMGMGAGMNGWELADAVRQRWPDVHFILATGWGAAIDPDEARAKGVSEVLAKPYRSNDLQRALSRSDIAA